MAKRTQQIFTTDEMTILLGLDSMKDKRRILKFVESREYNIVPSIKIASGRGTRRLYDLENVCEIALALRLLETGLRPQVIGKVIRQLRKKSRTSVKLEIEDFEFDNLELIILRRPAPGTPLNDPREQKVKFRQRGEIAPILFMEFDIICVRIGSTFLELKHRLMEQRPEWARENL